MRNMSFRLTESQYKAGTKTVTRRMGWEFLKPGDIVMGIVKGQGLEKGEHVVKLGPFEVISVCREPLRRLIDDPDYGFDEIVKEGFSPLTPSEFIDSFCWTHKSCTPETVITRIEFKKVVK